MKCFLFNQELFSRADLIMHHVAYYWMWFHQEPPLRRSAGEMVVGAYGAHREFALIPVLCLFFLSSCRSVQRSDKERQVEVHVLPFKIQI